MLQELQSLNGVQWFAIAVILFGIGVLILIAIDFDKQFDKNDNETL